MIRPIPKRLSSKLNSISGCCLQIQRWLLAIFTEANRERALPLLLQSLNALLQDDLIIGNTFSVADAALGTALAYIPMALKINLSPYPDVSKYVQNLSARPAFQKSFMPPS
jgi:glutathione S-transferase